MKRQSQERLPERVPFTAIPTGETPSLFQQEDHVHLGLEAKDIAQWAHSNVWTDRMLETLLKNRVKGGKWHALIDKVYSEPNLYDSARKVLKKQGAAGVDQQTVNDFAHQQQDELRRLAEELRGGSYRPSPVRRTWIPKPGGQEQRPLGIPTVRDRVIQTALVHVIEPILDHTFHERSFGFRRGRGCHDALRVVEAELAAGNVYVVDADLKGYFDTIPKDRLLQQVEERISDGRVLSLIKSYLDQGILEELRTWTPETGVPQGAVLSPVLANVYLNPLDHLASEAGFKMVRYADDFVILCATLEAAQNALELVRTWVEAAGLKLHPDKTHIVDSREQSFSFLGYSFRGKHIYPRKKSRDKFVARIRDLTPRKSGQSLERTIIAINQVTRGWFGYYRHCRWPIFKEFDGMIRRRLRRLLLKRHRQNPRRLNRHQRWPNAYFANLGLWSLREAHFRFAQSHEGNY
jgi:RNA-directed DNA polymerase